MKKQQIVPDQDIFTVTITNPDPRSEPKLMTLEINASGKEGMKRIDDFLESIKRESRHYCARCGERRYLSKMTLMFYHPIVRPVGIYCCTDTCAKIYKADLSMYSETGMFQLVEIQVKK